MAYLGKYYVKKTNTLQLTDTGSTQVACAVMIPPFAKVTRHWSHVWASGTNTVDSSRHMPWRCTAMYDALPRNVDQTENLADITMEEYRERYFPEGTESGHDGDASWGDADDNEDAEDDVDLPGGQRVTSVAKNQRVWHHEKMLGLPRNAVISTAYSIVYTDEFRRKGTVSNRGRGLDFPKMFIVVAGGNDPDTTVDDGDVMWGDSSNMSDLSEALTGIFNDGAYDLSSGMDNIPDTYPNIDKWLKVGARQGTSMFDDTGLGIISQITLEVKVYSPHTKNTISAP